MVVRCGDVERCGAKYAAVMLNVGVLWNSCGCGIVRCERLWLCDVEHVVKWWCRGRLQCYVEYGGLGQDVLQH